MSHYTDRDIEAQGGYYTRHVSAMTAERLHEKSDIAAELAHRDIEIVRLRAERDEARALLREIELWLLDDRLTKWAYIEGGDFYIAAVGYAARIDAALKDEK